jgi:cell wall-associated NlpC family hydrolase
MRIGFVLFVSAWAAGNAAGAWFKKADWLAAVTYHQAEDAVYLDTTGELPPQVNKVAGTDANVVEFELVGLRINPPIYTMAPRDGVVNDIRLEGLKERGGYRVVVTVETTKPFKYELERRQVEGDVSQVVLRFTDVDVKRSLPDMAGKAPLYARPAKETQVVAFVPYHTFVDVYDYAKGMYLVKTPDGTLGWVPGKNLRVEGENPFVKEVERPPPVGFRDGIVAAAREYLGVPYVWGGTSADGFDCSGLVQTVFAENGFQLPRGAGAQYRRGRKISKRSMMPGDLVFFRTYTSGPSHVGIYVGDGKFIHAESSPRGVTVTLLADAYWEARFLGARTWLAD